MTRIDCGAGRPLRHVQAAAAVLFLSLMACSQPQIETVRLERENPTEFVFPRTTAEVEAAIARAFADLRYRDMSLAMLPGHRGAHLYTPHEPISFSPVYRVDGRELPYLAEFYLQIEPLPGDNATRVAVAAEQAEVIAGTTSGFLNPRGPANIYVEVKPTTIEEYEILQLLGEQLGVKLPPSVTPAAREFDAFAYMSQQKK
jgi:hypothetical protein